MLKGLMGYFGLGGRSGLFGKKRGLPFMPALPFGGVLPVAAYLAWRNRDRIRSAFHRVSHRHEAAPTAA